MIFRFIRHLVRAIANKRSQVVKHGLNYGLDRLGPEARLVWNVVQTVCGEYLKIKSGPEALAADIEELARAPAEQVQQEAQAAVQNEAAGLPPEVQQALVTYLTQVPAMIRRSQRRPSDPTGRTLRASQSLAGPEDLLSFLPPRPPRFKPGDRALPGVDWVLEELLGIGGFGEVWKARHADLRSKPPVALKFCLDAGAVPALRNEAGMLDQVMLHGQHPGIVPLRQTYLKADPPCLEYEFVEGGDLASLIREWHESRRLTPTTANRYLLQLVKIVAFAHGANPPIVHGDLKPANVLVSKEADGEIDLRVIDFGIGGLAASQTARERQYTTRSRPALLTEAVRGAYTPLYASPEQMRRRPGEFPDPRDDVHALGVIWYQLLSGDLGMLHIPSDWREQVEERGLAEELATLLASCIAPVADKRPRSAIELAEQLAALLGANASAPPRAKAEGCPRELASERRPLQSPSAPAKAAKGRRAGDILTVHLGGGVEMNFVWCPPGTFLMGSPPDEGGRGNDETQHRVTLTQGFYLGVYPVTRCAFARFVKGSGYQTTAEQKGTRGKRKGAYVAGGEDEWKLDPARNWRTPGFHQTEEHPVVCVSWNDAYELCKWLTAKESHGRTFRLPTEAEWEYACRAGALTRFSFGNDETELSEYAWYGPASHGGTHSVGQKKPNPWGLHDMHGNVWEWCQDWYGPYPAGDLQDPEGGDTDSEERVLRGGSWDYQPKHCRCAHRNQATPDDRTAYIGCRLVLDLD